MLVHGYFCVSCSRDFPPPPSFDYARDSLSSLSGGSANEEGAYKGLVATVRGTDPVTPLPSFPPPRKIVGAARRLSSPADWSVSPARVSRPSRRRPHLKDVSGGRGASGRDRRGGASLGGQPLEARRLEQHQVSGSLIRASSDCPLPSPRPSLAPARDPTLPLRPDAPYAPTPLLDPLLGP